MHLKKRVHPQGCRITLGGNRIFFLPFLANWCRKVRWRIMSRLPARYLSGQWAEATAASPSTGASPNHAGPLKVWRHLSRLLPTTLRSLKICSLITGNVNIKQKPHFNQQWKKLKDKVNCVSHRPFHRFLWLQICLIDKQQLSSRSVTARFFCLLLNNDSSFLTVKLNGGRMAAWANSVAACREGKQ